MTRIQPCVLPGGGPVVAYDVGGDEDARPLVLLHGLSANSTSWAPVIKRTARGWRSYALDFRGHGRSNRTPGRYRLDDYVDDADRLLQMIGEPAVVGGHSLGAIVAAALAQDRHPLVAAVFLEDPPLYVVEPQVFAESGLARGFGVLRGHIARLQAERAPVDTYRDLLAASPHPAGDLPRFIKLLARQAAGAADGTGYAVKEGLARKAGEHLFGEPVAGGTVETVVLRHKVPFPVLAWPVPGRSLCPPDKG